MDGTPRIDLPQDNRGNLHTTRQRHKKPQPPKSITLASRCNVRIKKFRVGKATFIFAVWLNIDRTHNAVLYSIQRCERWESKEEYHLETR
jgi:hypothetical protein